MIFNLLYHIVYVQKKDAEGNNRVNFGRKLMNNGINEIKEITQIDRNHVDDESNKIKDANIL